jgi:NAD(P)-dependent dehydrogenase (short-subunit alcohol dehydrogenase family)
MKLQHVLVMGASGGIGLAMAKKISVEPELKTLILCAAHASSSKLLQELKRECDEKNIHCLIIDVDITDENSLAALVTCITPSVTALDLVFNAAGLLHHDALLPEKTITQISANTMQQIFAVNAFGPILLAKALWPWLRTKQTTVFASLSARVGSIEDNRLGGWYSYRAAKAAQNQFLKTMAIELARINPAGIVLALHPGTTDTLLSRPYQAGVVAEKLFTPEFVAERLLGLITDAKPEDSGSFIAWDGKRIPW